MAYNGPDRRMNDAALVAVGQSIDRMTEALETNLSEERLTNIVANEQKRDRVKLMAAVIGPIFVVGVVALFGLIQSHSNGGILKEARTTSNYVRHCLQHKTGDMTPEQVADECGAQDDGTIKFFTTYLNCALQITPTERTDANLNACVQQGIKAATG